MIKAISNYSNFNTPSFQGGAKWAGYKAKAKSVVKDFGDNFVAGMAVSVGADLVINLVRASFKNSFLVKNKGLLTFENMVKNASTRGLWFATIAGVITAVRNHTNLFKSN